MTDPAVIAELRERVAKATGADRELARDLASALFGIEWKPYSARARKLWGFLPSGSVQFYSDDIPLSWLRSIDAALALTERVLPGQQWVICNRAMRAISAHNRLVSGIDLLRELPLAILSALLSALSAKEMGDE